MTCPSCKPAETAKPEELRVGVFVCHCGLNIAGTVDVKAVAEYAKTIPDVVYVKENRYTCADPGQEEIRKAIREQKLNRVVIAACSPRMHEPTFRRTVSEAGLNPFLYEMANIREFASWCHQNYPAAATERAKDSVRMAVAKVRLMQQLQTIEVPVTNKALIIGGGIAGMNAALDLAEMGYKVYMLENSQSIGGHMAALDKTFPTLDCSICIEVPKMVDCGRHPNITIFANSELVKVDGYIGNFKVTIKKNPRYVLPEKCTGCGECKDACPIEYPNEWDMNLGTRKAISVPFDQTVPLKVFCTDITYIPFHHRFVYLSVIKDIASGEVMAWNLSLYLEMTLVTETVKNMRLDSYENIMIHSDQGFHYTNPVYIEIVKELKMIQSMSGKGNCIDNAPIESFFGHLKDELDYEQCKTFEDLRLVIEEYMRYYNQERKQVL